MFVLTPGTSSGPSVLRNVVTFFFIILFLQIKHSTCVCASRKPAITLWPGFSFISIRHTGSYYFLYCLFFYFFLFNQRFVQEFLGFECPCRRNISLKHEAPDTC